MTRIKTVHTCADCGTGWDYYFRKDGGLLSVPPSWGEVVAVVQEMTGARKIPSEHVAPEFPGDHYLIDESEFYYVFRAEDGTIRRARIDSSPFGRGKRSRRVPDRVEHFHYWVVDVCPAAGNAR